ncbi:MAG TPA: dephospho-CoA kinase [Acidimicrobiia bacterium]|nr:dephospho-CoA kinase [Acidimicrobiia bacterium]
MDRHFLLTGGIGSGKSTAGRVFGDLGAFVVSADRVGHAVIAPGGAASEQVAARFPEAVFGGEIDRSALAELVFADRAELRALEAITHPAIRAEIDRSIAGREGVVMVEVPLITDFFGPEWKRIVVDAPTEIRIRRLLDRGMAPDDIDARMAAQPSRGEWLEVADLVVDNRFDLTTLERECRAVWGRITIV